MKRRIFLKLSSLSAFAMLNPSLVQAYEYPAYDGPFWIFIQAIGGWDPTLMCNFQPKINNLDIAKTYKKAGNIEYIPISSKAEEFFNTYSSEMLVINGVNVQTNNHATGYVHFISGEKKSGHPTFGALLTNAYRLESPIGHIMSGGIYKNTAGIASSVSVRSGSDVETLAFHTAPSGSRTPRYSESITTRLQKAKEERIERLLKKHDSQALQKDISDYAQAHKNISRLEAISDKLTNGTGKGNLYRSTHLGITGYASDKMTLVVNTGEAGIGGFDTHGNHDRDHPACLDRLYSSVDDVIKDAKQMGVWEDTIIVMYSEIGRTPTYNSGLGKDHWPVSSMMMIGPRVQGNKVIGKTDHTLQPTKVDPNSLEVDEKDGVEITYADMNQLFRRYCKVENTPAAVKYSLKATELNINQFFK